MQGQLTKYGPQPCNVAFISGDTGKHLVLIGGLGDGLLIAPYADLMAEKLGNQGWSLVQPLLSSSYHGYGVSSLDADAEELHLLVKHLKDKFSSKGVILMGHSTGCQDAVRYAATFGDADDSPPIVGYILQACASDREAFSMSSVPDDVREERLLAAQLMMSNGEGEEILHRDPDTDGTPVCARRYLALLSRAGDDDMFSSDFSDEDLQKRLGHMRRKPCLMLIGGADEFVPKSVDKDLLARRLGSAAGAKALVIPGGNHKLEGREVELMNCVADFLQSLSDDTA